MGSVGMTELLLILGIILLLFGGRRIPQLMRGLGEGIRNFKDGLSGSSPTPPEKPDAEKTAQEKK